MSDVTSFAKDDYEDLDYAADYSAELDGLDDDIASSTWILASAASESAGVTSLELSDAVTPDFDKDSPAPVYRSGQSGAVAINSNITTVQINGGTRGETYRIMNRITTVAGRKYARVFDLYIKAKSEC